MSLYEILCVEDCLDCPIGIENPCPIAFVHGHLSHAACGNKVAEEILNYLVKCDDEGFVGCQMKETIKEIANRIPAIPGQMDLFEKGKSDG